MKTQTSDKVFRILVLALLAAFFASNLAKAEIGGDKFLHAGTSAALTTAVYFTMSAFTGREQQLKVPALIGSSILVLAVGLGGEVIDAGERPAGQRYLDGGDMAANAIGVGVAAGLIYLLDARTIEVHPRGVAFRF